MKTIVQIALSTDRQTGKPDMRGPLFVVSDIPGRSGIYRDRKVSAQFLPGEFEVCFEAEWHEADQRWRFGRRRYHA